jgi:hypothetical protein
MKERPILFSGPMVRAILDGHKTMTRRVIKPQPKVDGWRISVEGRLCVDGQLCSEFITNDPACMTEVLSQQPCPYGVVGDRLWVRERWVRIDDTGGTVTDLYKADYDAGLYDERYTADFLAHLPWCSPIFMPRYFASRITLEITGTRVERVQDISEDDALAEGCTQGKCSCGGAAYACTDCMNTGITEPASLNFLDLWNSINAKRGYGCDVNPWVRVIEFRRVE